MQMHKLYKKRSILLFMPETSPCSRINISLPRRLFSELSHIENINYCIEQLQKAARTIESPVVGYLIERSLGTHHAYYRIVPKVVAELERSRNQRFSYATLDDFLNRKQEITAGKYLLSDDGLILRRVSNR